MWKNRLCYLALLACTGLFFICYDGYLSLYVFSLSLLLPFVSLAVSLPGMLGARAVLSAGGAGASGVPCARKGENIPLRLRVWNITPFSSGRIRVRLSVENTLTGQREQERFTISASPLPQVLEQYREALRLSEEHPEQLLRWWRSGPVFRGLVSDGGGGFLCQVFWFRDQEMQVGDVYPREDGAPWPVEYLCHTVHLLPDGPYWTVEKLAETEGLLEDDFYDMDLPLCGPVTWSGEADGLRLEISAAQILETGDGFLGRERLRTLHDPSSFPCTIGETEEDDALSPAPMPRLPGFSALYSGMVVTRENTCGQQRSYMEIGRASCRERV